MDAANAGERFTLAELVETYARHPLTADTILARLRRQNRLDRPLTEDDLAIDDESAITDQNHVGGREFALQLAELAGMHAAAKVLDACSGLGGTARLVAARLGCAVDAVEITPQRHRDAVKLTELVGMSQCVRHIEGDFLTLDLPHDSYDLILSQGAFVHFRDKARLLARCRELLRAGGILAFEDSCICLPIPAEELKTIAELEDCWRAYLVSDVQWKSLLQRAGFACRAETNLTAALRDECGRQLNVAFRKNASAFTAAEILAWRHANQLCRSSLLGYWRFVANAQ